ncbi:MAG: lipid-A-disaccharide synthase-related protein [Gemmatimonadaceae bacterium]
MTHAVLFVSNGHGEDAIACKVIDRVRSLTDQAALELRAWPMVGRGDAYARSSVPIVGPLNQLPSEGFATLDARLLVRDLRAGWVRTHWRQLQAARALRGRYALIIAVGDVVPIAAARLARTPCVFIGCAKSAYYGPGYGYTALELRWLRRWCRVAFPRDRMTATALARAGVPVTFAGNPMMDDLTERGVRLVRPGDVAIACLPGSRVDAVANALRLLTLLPSRPAAPSGGVRMHYVFALAPDFDADALLRTLDGETSDLAVPHWIAEPLRVGDFEDGVILRLTTRDGGAVATFVTDALVDAVRQCRLTVGLAGTANEQAIGLESPLIVLAGQGNQGAAYTRMKMRYFGKAAVYCDSDRDALSRTLFALLEDEGQRQLMIDAGTARMGAPGASDAIADCIVNQLVASSASA